MSIRFYLKTTDLDNKHPSVLIEGKSKFQIFKEFLKLTKEQYIHKIEYLKK